MTSPPPLELHAAAVAAATEQLRLADAAYHEARQPYSQRAARLREEMVGPARRGRLRPIQTLAGLTSAGQAGQVLGFTGSRARQLIAEARRELAGRPSPARHRPRDRQDQAGT